MANHVKGCLSSSAARRLKLLLLAFTLNGMIMQTKVNAQEQVAEPNTGLLCISECTTCPIICSPPPSYHSSPPLPPTPSYKSPPSEYPPRIIYYSPPKSYSMHPPPPPFSYSSLGAPPPPRPQQPPPTPWTYFSGSPPGPLQPTQGAQGGGYRGYPDPYFYVSKASSLSCSLSLHATLLFLVLFSIHVMLIFSW